MLFQDLDVYKLSLQLAIDVHKTTLAFPRAGGFTLADQMRRAAYSIPSNIAEGAMRNNPKEYIQFVGISRGSCAEIITLLQICKGVGYASAEPSLEVTTERVSKMLMALLRSLRDKTEA